MNYIKELKKAFEVDSVTVGTDSVLLTHFEMLEGNQGMFAMVEEDWCHGFR